MLPPAGTYIFRHDFLGDDNLRSCSASTQGVWINAKVVMSGAPRYGELCFDDNPQNWQFDYEKACEFALSDSPKKATRNRETTGKPPGNHRETTGKPPGNHRETRLFRELEKRTSLEARVIARGLVTLVAKGVFHCNQDGYIEDPAMVRERIERENNAKRQRKFRVKGDTRNACVTPNVTVLPPSPSLYTSPLSSPKGEETIPPAGFQKRRRRRPTKMQLDAQVGAGTGDGSVEKFVEAFFAAGYDGADLEKAYHELGGPYPEKITPNLNYKRRSDNGDGC